MGTKNKIIAVIGVVLNLTIWADVLPCGSDGPRPLAEITLSMEKVTQINTHGNVQDFTLEKDTLYYRNTENEIIKHSLVSEFSKVLNKSLLPLSRVMDPFSQVLLVEESGSYLDLSSHDWMDTKLSGKATPLVFGRKVFYSAVETKNSGIEIYRTQVGEFQATQWCAFSDLKLAQGHNFPWVYLYKTFSTETHPTLEVQRINIETCAVQNYITFENMAGPVEKVWRFDSINGTAAKIKDPTKNFYWDDEIRNCRYYNIGGLDPLITNFRVPLLAVWSAKTGLELIDPIQDRRSVLFPGKAVRQPITERDLYFSDSGKTVYLLPNLDEEKPLWEIKFRK